MDLTEADIKTIHPDYPTVPEALNVMYREHSQRIATHFEAKVAANAWDEGAKHGIYRSSRAEAVLFDLDNPYRSEN